MCLVLTTRAHQRHELESFSVRISEQRLDVNCDVRDEYSHDCAIVHIVIGESARCERRRQKRRSKVRILDESIGGRRRRREPAHPLGGS